MRGADAKNQPPRTPRPRAHEADVDILLEAFARIRSESPDASQLPELLRFAELVGTIERAAGQRWQWRDALNDSISGAQLTGLALPLPELAAMLRRKRGYPAAVLTALDEGLNRYQKSPEQLSISEAHLLRRFVLAHHVHASGWLEVDPIELDWDLQPALVHAERLADAAVGDSGLQLGRCHVRWAVKKSVLSENYGINWRSPSELNPGVLFD